MQYNPNYTDISAVVYNVDPRWDEQLKMLGGRFSDRLRVGPGYTFNRDRTDLKQLEALVTRANASTSRSPVRTTSPARSRIPPPPPPKSATKRTPKTTVQRLPASPPKASIPPIPSPSRKLSVVTIIPRPLDQTPLPSPRSVETQIPVLPASKQRSLVPVPISPQMSAGDRAQQALLNAHLGIHDTPELVSAPVRVANTIIPFGTSPPQRIQQQNYTLVPFAASSLALPELGLPIAGTSLQSPQRLYTRAFHGPPPAGAAQKQQRASEDRYQLQELGTHALDGSFEPEFLYYAVFDGHGGSRMMGPAHVADYAVEHLHRDLANALSSVDRSSVATVEETIKRTFVEFDRTLHSLHKLYGTTATVVLRDLHRHRLYLINLGDSRSMVFDRNNGTIIAATVDHEPDLESEKQRIKAGGGQVLNFYGTARVNGSLAVARAFGDFEFKIRTRSSYDPVNGLVSAVPDVMMIPDQPEYRILLTSDAPYERNRYTDADLIQMIRSIPATTPQAAAEQLVERIYPNTSDDVTIVLG